jgi:hypothetical protein
MPRTDGGVERPAPHPSHSRTLPCTPGQGGSACAVARRQRRELRRRSRQVALHCLRARQTVSIAASGAYLRLRASRGERGARGAASVAAEGQTRVCQLGGAPGGSDAWQRSVPGLAQACALCGAGRWRTAQLAAALCDLPGAQQSPMDRHAAADVERSPLHRLPGQPCERQGRHPSATRPFGGGSTARAV